MTIKVTYNVTDVYMSQSVSPVYINVSYSDGGASGGGVWGTITGTLSNQTDLQTALDLKVPYSGATGNVDLGEYELKAGQVTLDTSPTGTAAVGTIRWNDTTGTSETTLKGGNVIIKNGVDLVARVVNKVSPNTTLTKAAYQAVRVSGAQGQRLAVALAQANNDTNSADTIGLVTETIPTNQEGFIMTMGQLENINTTGTLQGETWVDGDVLYLSPTTAGALTNIKPTGSGHIVVIGYVEYAHVNNGKIYTKVMNGWELDELHDVDIISPANNEALIYESSTSLWKNKTIATALGFTPANAATTLTINGVTYDLSTSRTWTIAAGISGSGASGQVTYWTGASAVSGSNNLFWDNANGRLGIGTTTPSQVLHINNGAIQLTDSFPIRWGTSNLLYGSTTGLDITNTSFAVRFRFTVGGNFLINGIADSGQRLQVYGDTLLRGSGATSATTALTVQNSSSTNLFLIDNAGNAGFSTTPNASFRVDISGDLRATNFHTGVIYARSSAIQYISSGGSNINQHLFNTTSSQNGTSGDTFLISSSSTFNPTSGNATYSNLRIIPTINQTGGANGITRGLYVNPTLTSAADFRAIETTNGKIVFGNLPTSSAGLPTGALWNNAGVINIV